MRRTAKAIVSDGWLSIQSAIVAGRAARTIQSHHRLRRIATPRSRIRRVFEVMAAPARDGDARPPGPIVGVGALIFRDDRVLLVRRGNPPRLGEWSIPGGHASLGETVFETACREVREETAVIIRPIATVDVVDLIERDEATGEVCRHFTLIEVLGVWVSGQPHPGDDALEAAWVAMEDLDRRHLWSETQRVIKAAFSAWERLGRP